MKKVATRPFILPILIIVCTLFYYFGELIDWAAWDILRNEFFYGVHDIHRLLFLAPIIYAGYTARLKGAVIITLVSFVIFLPRAFFISPFPDPLLRMVIFTLGAGAIGCLVARIRNEQDRSRRLESEIAGERDKLRKIVDGMADGIIITGPDFKIRFINSRLKEIFGDGIGLPCYQHLYNRDAPCQTGCRIPDVINLKKIEKWECSFPAGKKFEVLAAPYVDSDGTVCQISIFRDITER